MRGELDERLVHIGYMSTKEKTKQSKEPHLFKYKVGDKCNWITSNTEKQGTILALVPADSDVKKILASLGLPFSSQFNSVSRDPRYLIKGEPLQYSRGRKTYCPNASFVEQYGE